jgi:2-polyprenyl-3-methyl-5-hydroxy-6-metoxy-1,4-benzoquinol methylase
MDIPGKKHMLKSVAPAAVLALLLSPLTPAQTAGEVKLWQDFVATAKSDQTQLNPENHRQHLIQGGMTEAQANERVALLRKLYDAYPAFRQQIQAIGFNNLYRDRNQTRFTTDPSTFLVAMTKDLKPGRALDVAMGQGRNVLYLASKGWDVTGFDIAEEGLKVAQANAARAGLAIRAVKAGWDDFDFGHEQWDLICFIYTDAPVVDPQFVARVRDGLKTGGLLLMDRPYRSLDHPEPQWRDTEADKANAWLKAWSSLQIVHYEDTTGVGDWQQTAVRRQEYGELRLVRMLARKR